MLNVPATHGNRGYCGWVKPELVPKKIPLACQVCRLPYSAGLRAGEGLGPACLPACRKSQKESTHVIAPYMIISIHSMSRFPISHIPSLPFHEHTMFLFPSIRSFHGTTAMSERLPAALTELTHAVSSMLSNFGALHVELRRLVIRKLPVQKPNSVRIWTHDRVCSKAEAHFRVHTTITCRSGPRRNRILARS